MAAFNHFYNVNLPSQPSYQQIPINLPPFLQMNYNLQNTQYNAYLSQQTQLLMNQALQSTQNFRQYENQDPLPLKKVKTEPTEPTEQISILNDLIKQDPVIKQEFACANTAENSSANNSSPENILKELEPVLTEEIEMPPVIDQESGYLEVKSNRAAYSAFFSQMEEKMMACWKQQLEFLKMLQSLNKPELAERNPVLDKINPLIAGVMGKKSRIDENTLTVMKRTHKILKAGPAVRSTTPKYKLNKDNTEKRDGSSTTGKNVLKEFEAPFTSNFARKKQAQNSAQAKEADETTDQLMAFILQGLKAAK